MKRLIKYIILFVFVCVGNVTWAEEGERESSLFPDSSYVLRGPKADFLEKYRKDAAFDYTTNIEDSPSIWDWINVGFWSVCFGSRFRRGQCRRWILF